MSDLKYLGKVRSKVFKILIANWFPLQVIKEQWLKCRQMVYGNVTNNRGIQEISKEVGKSGVEYRSLAYIEGLSEMIDSILKNEGFCNIKLSYRPINKIVQFVHNMKEKIEIKRKKDVVYEISCKKCDLVYVGHTSMWVERRLYHHKSNAKPTAKTGTALSAHLLRNLHEADWEGVKVLHTESKIEKRRILESMYIYMNNERVMNDRNESGLIGTIYAAVMKHL